MSDNKRKLYDALSQDYDMGTFEQFCSDIDNPEKRRKLYDATIEEYDFGDYDSFSKQLGFGNEQPKPSLEVEQANVAMEQPVSLDPTIAVPTPKVEDEVKQDNVQNVKDNNKFGTQFKSGMPQVGSDAPTKKLAELNKGAMSIPKINTELPTMEGVFEREQNLKDANRGQVSELAANIEQQLNRRGEELDAEAAKNPIMMQAHGTAQSIPSFDANRTIDPEYRNYNAAKKSLEAAQNMIDAADANAEGEGFFGSVGRGFGEKFFDLNTYDMGMGDLSDNTALLKALDAYDKGELTPSQQALLDAKAVELATAAYFGSEVGRGYKAGKATAESIPFMIEMAINPAKAVGQGLTQRVARFAIDRFGKKSAKAAALKAAGRAVGDLMGASTMTATTGAIRTAADAARRMQGDIDIDIDKNGEAFFAGHIEKDSPLKAAAKAFANTTIENYSEMVGEYFAPVIGKGTSLGRKALDKVHLGKVNDFIDNVAASDVARAINQFENYAKWNGTIGEFAEEMVGGALNAAIVGDQKFDNSEEGIFNGENMADTALSVGLLGGFFSSIKTAGYPFYKIKANRAIDSARVDFKDAFGDKPEFNALDEALSSNNLEQAKIALAGVLADESLKAEDKEKAVKYAQAIQRYNGAVRADQKRREELQTPEQNEVEASFEQGYDLNEPQQMNDAQLELDAASDELRRVFGLAEDEDIDAFLGDDPLEGIMLSREMGANAEEQYIKLNYLNAKAKVEGMYQKVRDDIDTAVEQSNKLIESRVNKDTQKITPATLKAEDRQVYIVAGTVVMFDDGSAVNTGKSSKDIIVRDANTGKLEMLSPNDVLRVDEAIDPVQEKAMVTEAIRDEKATIAANNIDGVVPFNAGDEYVVMFDDGTQHTAKVLADNGDGNVQVQIDNEPQATVASKEQVQQMVNTANKARVAQNKQAQIEQEQVVKEQAQQEAEKPKYAEKDTITIRLDDGREVRGSISKEADADGNIEVFTEQPIDGDAKVAYFTEEELDGRVVMHNDQAIELPTPEPVTALSQIPVNENSEPLFEQAPASLTYDALVEMNEGDAAEALDTAQQMLAIAKKELKAEERSTPKVGGNVMEIQKAKAEKKERMKPLQERVAYWESVVNEPTQRKAKKAETASLAEKVEAPKAEEVAEVAPQEVIEEVKPVVEMTPEESAKIMQKVEKRKGMAKAQSALKEKGRYAKEDAELGDYLDFNDYVMRAIATGSVRFKWSNKPDSATRGLGAHLGASASNEERQSRIWMLSNDFGLYPEEAAEQLLTSYAEYLGYEPNIDTMGALSEIIDIVQSYPKSKMMMEAAQARHAKDSQQAENDYYENEYVKQAAEENGMTVDEWMAFIDEYVAQYDDIKAIFAEAYLEYEQLNQNNNEQGTGLQGVQQAVSAAEQNTTNDNRGSEVLPTEQSNTNGGVQQGETERRSDEEANIQSNASVPISEVRAAEAEVNTNPTEAPVKAETPTISQESEQVGEQEKLQISAKEEMHRKPLRERAKMWEAKVGVPVQLIETFEEITTEDARKVILDGKVVSGWVVDGQVYLYMPYLHNLTEVDKTYLHEVVAHEGMKRLLGKEGYRQFCERVYNEVMTEADRAFYDAYPGVKNHAQAADEYIAKLSETTDLESTVWQKVVRIFRNALRVLGIETAVTNKDIQGLLRDSFRNLAEENGSAAIDEGETRFSIKGNNALSNLHRASDTIRKWVENDVRGKSFQIELPESVSRQVRREMGRDFESHNITANGIAHALKNHGVEGKKLSENSIPIRKEDAELIPYIMVAPSYIRKGSTKNNRESVRYYKTISNGYVVVVEKEVDNSIDDLETINMWAELSDVSNAVSTTLNRTSETPTISRSDIAKIIQDAENAIEKERNFKFRVTPTGNHSLVGVHNLSLDKLRKAIKMGGLANPSVAVIDVDKQMHEDYGEYSLILPNNLVDARQGKNAGTWAGDAWTPTYPQMTKRISKDKDISRFFKDIKALPDAIRGKVRLDFDSFMDGRSANALAYWYLFEKGIAPEFVEIPARYPEYIVDAVNEATNGSYSMYGLSAENRAKCVDAFVAYKYDGNRAAYDADMDARKERLEHFAKSHNKAFIRKKAQGDLDAINEYGFDYDKVSSFVRDVEWDVRHKGEINVDATVKASMDYIAENNLGEEYDAWRDNLDERYGIEEYIFDGYTNSGTPRYLPHTIGNASKWMKKQGRQGAVATFPSFGTFVAVSIPKMTTLESIRKRKNLLGKSKEEYDAFREKWENVYFELGKKLQPDAKGFDDYGYWRLIEAVEQKNPKEYIKKQYNIELSAEDVNTLNEMLNAIRNEYPARYFETKFERPLQLNDFAAAVVPDDVPMDVWGRLNDANVKIFEYEKGNSSSRAEAMQKATATDDIRFRVITPAPTFYSNAERAVENVKQEKATPQQWLAMIEKNGGLKAGEDKWLGLSDWLKAADKKTISKQEVLDFIKENQIQIEEVEYVENPQGFEVLKREYDGWLRNEGYDYAWEQLTDRYGDDAEIAFADLGGELQIYNAEVAATLLGDERSINPTRLGYTTEGLENNKEIALVVPTIESWNESDEIHFGDAGQGRAIAWVRFGETTAESKESIAASEAVENFLAEMREKYGTPVGEETDAMGKSEISHLQRLTARELNSKEHGERVLVIDEVQSKRHQEGREKGYASEEVQEAQRQRDYLYKKMYRTGLTIEEHERYYQLGEFIKNNFGIVPPAPFEKNWAELAMKRMLRYAAENGFDKIAWTTGEQQAERYSLGAVMQGLTAYKTSPNTYYVIPYNNGAIGEFVKEYDEKELAETFGKEIAINIITNAENATEENPYEMTGDDLRIGASGMKAFYDQMLPSFMNKYGKKWGVKVQDVTLPHLAKSSSVMHSIDVTDAMRESVMQGQPMFRPTELSNIDDAVEAKAEKVFNNTKAIATAYGIDNSIVVATSEADFKAKMLEAGVEEDYIDQDAIAVYIPETGEIVINSQKVASDKDLVESVVHEKAHNLTHNIDKWRNIYDAIIPVGEERFVEFANNVLKENLSPIKSADEIIATFVGKSAILQTEDGRYLVRAMLNNRITSEDIIGYLQSYFPSVYAQYGDVLTAMHPFIQDSLETIKKQYNERRNNVSVSRVGRETRPSNGGDAYGGLATPTSDRGSSTIEGVSEVRREPSERRGRTVEERTQSRILAATTLAESLGVKLNVVEDVNDITDANSTMQRAKRGAKAWYDVATDQVYFVAPNATSVQDAEESVLHEVVAHKGLRDVVGRERFNAFLEKVYRGADADTRKKITEMAAKNGWNFRVATEEYLASLAERGFEDKENRTFFEKVRDLFMDMLREAKIAIGYNITDNDMRYMLWRTYQMQKSKGVMAAAEDVVMQQKLGVGNFRTRPVGEDIPRLTKYKVENIFGGIWIDNPQEFAKFVSAVNNYAFEENGEGIAYTDNHFYAYYRNIDGTPIPYIDIYLNADESQNVVNQVNKEVQNVRKGKRVEKYIDSAISRSRILQGDDNVISGNNNSSSSSRTNGGLDRNISRKGQYANNPSLYVKTERTDGDGVDDVRFRSTDKAQPAEVGTARKEYDKAVRRHIEGKNTVGKYENVGYKIKEAYQDSMLSVKKLQEAIIKEAGGKLLDSMDAYTAENQLSSKNKAEMEAYERDYANAMMEQIGALLNDGASYEEIVDYMLAKHGLERNIVFSIREAEKRGGIWNGVVTKDYAGLTELTGDEKNFTDEAQKIVDEFEQKHDTEAIWKAINAATKASLKKSYDSGMMDKETFNNVSTMFNYYIPLRGWDNNSASNHYEYIGGSNVKISPALKTAKGRKSRADDPIATILLMGQGSIVQGNRNKMKQRLLNLALAKPTSLLTVNDAWYVKQADGTWRPEYPVIPENATGDEVDAITKQFEEKMEALGANAQKSKKGLELGYHTTAWEGQEHTIRVMRNGKEYLIFVNGNPNAAQAINGFTNPNAAQGKFAGVEEFVSKWTRVYGGLLTSQNPAFMFSNLSRDLIFAGTAVAIKEDAKYATKYTKNIASILGKGKTFQLLSKWEKGKLDTNNEVERYFKEFLENGGETGFTNMQTLDDYKRNVESFLKKAKGSKMAKVKAPVENVLDFMEHLNRGVEDMTRFAVYMTSRQSGRSITQSVANAKDITVNFNKKGRGNMGAGVMNLMYLFFNATVQSLANFGGLFKNHPVKATTAATLMASAGMLVPMLMAALSDDDEEQKYYDLPDWVRRNNLCLRIPATDTFITIPMPHELRPFYGLGEIFSSMLSGQMSVADGLKEAAQGFASLSPIDFLGNDGDLRVNLTPSLFQPLAQLAVNKDYFGTPIQKETPYNELDPEWTKAYKGTNATLVEVTKAINTLGSGDEVKSGGWLDWSPAKIEHIFESYLGGMGKTLNRAGKTISMLWNEDAQTWRNVPIASSFVYKADERNQNRAINEKYYEAIDEAEDTAHTVARYKKIAKNPNNLSAMEYAEKLDEFMKSPTYKRYTVINDAKKKITKAFKELDNVDKVDRKAVEDFILETKLKMFEELENIEEQGNQ